jgi:superfamily II DNA helicase RecQ
MNIKVFNIRLDKEHCQEDQKKMNEFLDAVDIKLTSTNFVTTTTLDFWSAVVFFEPKKDSKAVIDESELTVEEKKIYVALKQWRNDLAKESGWSAFRICHNSHLISIAKAKPQTVDELKIIKSFGESRTANYGDDIISLLNAL